MKQTSPMNTATAAGAAAVLSPVVAYVASLCNLKLPPEVLGSLVVIIVAGAHWLGDFAAERTAKAAGPAPAGQHGIALVSHMLVLALLAALLAVLSGCASLTDAGHVAYTFEPVLGADGKPTGGCKFSAADGKEFSSRNIAATSSAEGCRVVVQEGASTAFQGQAIAGKALSVLPSFAPMVLPQGPAALATKP